MKRPVCPEVYGGHQCETEGDHDLHACKCGVQWEVVNGITASWAVRV